MNKDYIIPVIINIQRKCLVYNITNLYKKEPPFSTPWKNKRPMGLDAHLTS